MRFRMDQAKADQENWQEEMCLTRIGWECTVKVLLKIVVNLIVSRKRCPMDRFMARKRKLDVSRAVLGEELYAM